MTESFHEHLLKRCWGLPRGYGYVDYDQELYTVPLWNFSGQMVGYQQYNWQAGKLKKNNPKEGRYFTYITKDQDKCTRLGVFGLEHCKGLHKSSTTLYVVEGVFEAIAGLDLGENFIAVLGNDQKRLKGWLDSLPCNTIALCQPDAAGRKLRNVCDGYEELPCDFDDYRMEGFG